MQAYNLPTYSSVIDEIKTLITTSKYSIAEEINSSMIVLYWNIGKHINEEITKNDESQHRDQLIKSLAKILINEHGKDFSYMIISKMSRFHEIFAENIMRILAKKLSWGHIIELLNIKYSSEREFYIYMAISKKWSIKQLKHNIEKMLYSTTIGFQKLEDYHKEIMNLITHEDTLNIKLVMKDPYILEFLKLPSNYAESNLSNNIIKELENFLLEQHNGFSLITRQKRMTIKDSHYWVDLLFYQRKMRRIIAVDVATDGLKEQHKQLMILYLYWLKKYESLDNENPPIGIIISIEKHEVHIELCEISNNEAELEAEFKKILDVNTLKNKLNGIILKCNNDD